MSFITKHLKTLQTRGKSDMNNDFVNLPVQNYSMRNWPLLFGLQLLAICAVTEQLN